MSKIEVFNPGTCQTLRAEMDAALNTVAKNHGIKISIGKMVYSENTISAKIEVATLAKNGLVNTRAAEDFKLYAAMYDLKPTSLGKTFKLRGEDWQIIGMNPRKKKYPIQCKKLSDGKTYGLHPEDVQRGLSQP